MSITVKRPRKRFPWRGQLLKRDSYRDLSTWWGESFFRRRISSRTNKGPRRGAFFMRASTNPSRSAFEKFLHLNVDRNLLVSECLHPIKRTLRPSHSDLTML